MTSPQRERQPIPAGQVSAPASIGSAGVPVSLQPQSTASRLPVFSPSAVLRMLWQCGLNQVQSSQGGAA
ncbi:MAG: hypothetical protein LBE30_05740 [Comamonas sp.]|jgi:hypothetical protein|nr:hypothetical protein [Comamonas sp.]